MARVKDVPAQFSVFGLLGLTAAAAMVCALARAMPAREVMMLVVPWLLVLAPCLIACGANYLLFFLTFHRRMAVADTAMLLLATLTGFLGLAVGCFGIVAAAILFVVWAPQLLLYWEWRSIKEPEIPSLAPKDRQTYG